MFIVMATNDSCRLYRNEICCDTKAAVCVAWTGRLVRSIQFPLSACWLFQLCHCTPGLLCTLPYSTFMLLSLSVYYLVSVLNFFQLYFRFSNLVLVRAHSLCVHVEVTFTGIWQTLCKLILLFHLPEVQSVPEVLCICTGGAQTRSSVTVSSVWLGPAAVCERDSQCVVDLAHNEKSTQSERCKHCALAVVRRSQKFSPCHRPHSRGRRMAKINQLEMVTYLHLQIQFGEDQCMQFRVIMVTDPQTNRTDYNSLHC